MKLCVSALPNNYLQLRLTAVWPIVKGLAIRSAPPPLPPPNPPLALSVLECGQTPCENDPNSPLLTLHTPQLTLRGPAPNLTDSLALSHLSRSLFSACSRLPLFLTLHHPPASVSSSQSFRRRRFLWDLILFVVVGWFRGNTDNGYSEMGSSHVVLNIPQRIDNQ